jgi:crotonobetainyl-CoA:carnitine CoA-transferase CaiB-like acyl-CoA transferase
LTRIWPCKDGYISWFFWEGVMSVPTNLPLIKWMESEGLADEFLLKYDWAHFDNKTTQAEIDRIEAFTAPFFLAHTKAELFEGAIHRNVQVYPVSTASDMLNDAQLAARKFWVEIDHPELGSAITYPGAFACTSQVPPRLTRRAPLVGEHNREVLETELGLSHGELLTLMQAGVV